MKILKVVNSKYIFLFLCLWYKIIYKYDIIPCSVFLIIQTDFCLQYLLKYMCFTITESGMNYLPNAPEMVKYEGRG